MPMRYDIRAEHGADCSIDFVCRDPRAGYVTDIAYALLTVRTTADGTPAYTFDSDVDNEITFTGERVELRIPWTTVNTYPAQVSSYDLEIRTVEGARYNPFVGSFIVSADGDDV